LTVRQLLETEDARINPNRGLHAQNEHRAAQAWARDGSICDALPAQTPAGPFDNDREKSLRVLVAADAKQVLPNLLTLWIGSSIDFA